MIYLCWRKASIYQMDILSFGVDRGTEWCNVGADKRYSSRGDLVDETRQSQARHTQDKKIMDGAERGWRLAGTRTMCQKTVDSGVS